MKKANWRIVLALSLMVASGLLYCLQIVVFRHPSDTFFYMVQDLAFVPIQVLLVTLVVNEMLARREKSLLQQKMNMVIGAFFVEMGNDLLANFARLDLRADEMRQHMHICLDWSERDFANARRSIRKHSYALKGDSTAFRQLKDLLTERKTTLLRLLENPNLLEHESFTDVLWAVCHLNEELEYRSCLDDLPDTDLAHLEGDAERAYRELISEWLSYVAHLKSQYPYMFSLVLRTNPFDPEAAVTLR